MKLPSINNRELLPIRLMPFVFGFNLTPLDLAMLLAHKQGLAWPVFRPEDELFAYHLDTEDSPSRMLSQEWLNFVSDIKVAARKLKLQETFEDENYRPWRLEALKLLPARVFVWKDEFEAVFQASFIRNGKTYSENANVETKELNFHPFIEPQYLPVIWEGFEALRLEPPATDQKTHNAKRTVKGGSQRSDLLSEEIAAAIDELGGDRTAKKVMNRLKEYAGKEGSCIVAVIPDGITWQDRLRVKKNFDLEALRKRLARGNLR